MRQITEHMINAGNRRLEVSANEPNPNGASYRYEVRGFSTELNPCYNDKSNAELVLLFQNGPVNDAGEGVNGITHEMLLAIVADRLRGFQTGPFACRENALALTKIEEAQHWLGHRTRARQQRGVEGTLVP